MIRPLSRVPFALLTLAFASAPFLPSAAAAVDAFDFSGSITDVGVQRGPGQVGGVEFRIRGKFALDHPLDLSRATVVLEELFVDDAEGGLGELMTTVDDMPTVPLELVARAGDPDNNVFDQPGNYRPHVRLQIQERKGAFEFRLKLDRGLMRRRPRVCEENTDASNLPDTPISQRISIDDGVNPPVDLAITRLWTCTKPGRYHMRSVPEGEPPAPTPAPTTPALSGTPGAPPTPTPVATPIPTLTGTSVEGNSPPIASLKQNAIAGDGGVRNVIELDARDSHDRDGTIVRYRFDSGDGRVQDGSDPVARFAYASGDHRAFLQVFDDRGAASDVVARGFSVKD
ncbi:MAG TPA: PKD domain-containing protein [Candidatus Binatia bacterium]|nr:PKD domain-containing protein [Candidatus Binatia bacterium]